MSVASAEESLLAQFELLKQAETEIPPRNANEFGNGSLADEGKADTPVSNAAGPTPSPEQTELSPNRQAGLGAPPRILVRDVHKTFVLHTQGGVKLAVLANAELTVNAGECLALTGPSGAGKSTLLRCLYGNYLPTQGSIEVLSGNRWIDLTSASPTEIVELRRNTVGWVSQFLRVIPRIPTIDIVAEPLLHQGVSKAESRDRARNLLARLNVPERLWQLAPSTFSGGEQQRVNVARGLVGDHPILLVDEPTASLDAANSAVVTSLLFEARERGAALVGIFHDEAVRKAIATRTLDVTHLTP